jgi:hypothetical protein
MKRVDRKTFHLIAAQPIAAVMGELIHLQLHPNIAPLQASLLAELALYHEEAVAVVPTPDQQWQFWRARKLILKVWYPAACTIALVMSSSACVERTFALYESMFTDEQENALQDYKSGCGHHDSFRSALTSAAWKQELLGKARICRLL